MISPEQEKELIKNFFFQVRDILNPYIEDRKFFFSNSQLFGFLLISPITIAIASDGNVDFAETNMLIEIAAFFEKNVLPSVFDTLEQPENILSDAEFKKIIYSELRYLCLTMNKYESALIQALKLLLALDKELAQEKHTENSIPKKIIEMMHSVIYNNSGEDIIEEHKVKKVIQELGLE